jgi:hypothetical protein
MKMTKLAFLGALSLAAACGGGGDGGVNRDTDGLAENPVSASGTANAAAVTAGLGTAFAGGGDGAAAAVSSLNSAALGLAIGGSARVIKASDVAGDCICDETGCTFDQCGTEDQYINGTVAIDGDHYTWELDFVSTAEGQSFQLDYNGDLTITETSIDGSASATGGGSFENEGQSISLELDWELVFNAVELDPACTSGPIGGSMDAFSRFVASSQGQTAGYFAEGSVTFGPACGQVAASE